MQGLVRLVDDAGQLASRDIGGPCLCCRQFQDQQADEKEAITNISHSDFLKQFAEFHLFRRSFIDVNARHYFATIADCYPDQ